MMSDLVERLREGYPGRYDAHLILMWADEITDEAADRIQELEAENAALREALELLEKYVAHNGDDWVQRQARAALEKCK